MIVSNSFAKSSPNNFFLFIVITALILLKVTNINAQAQNYVVDGFWGLKFGQKKSECLGILKAKGITPAISEGDVYKFQNVKFAGKICNIAAIFFLKDQLVMGIFVYRPNKQIEIIDDYVNMSLLLMDKYGRPDSTLNKYESPFDHPKTNSDRLIAITTGYAKHMQLWYSTEKVTARNFVKLEIAVDPQLVITYAYGPVFKLIEDNERKKALDDL